MAAAGVLLLVSCTGDPHPPSARGTSAGADQRPVTGVKTRRPGLEVGVPYRIDLYTHCGIDHWTRFDGSFWDAVGYDNRSGNPPRFLGNPSDRGVMTLLSRDEAVYESSSGRLIRFERGPKRRPPGMVCF